MCPCVRPSYMYMCMCVCVPHSHLHESEIITDRQVTRESGNPPQACGHVLETSSLRASSHSHIQTNTHEHTQSHTTHHQHRQYLQLCRKGRPLSLSFVVFSLYSPSFITLFLQRALSASGVRQPGERTVGGRSGGERR